MEISVSKAMLRILLGFALATAFTVAAQADLITGPVSKYYLDSPSTNMIYVVQGLSVVESFPMAYGMGEFEGALAVSQTIQTRASDLRFRPDLGAGEYTLSGQPIAGSGYLTPATGNLVYYDGTSDGSNNYFVDHGQNDPAAGGVYQTGPDWTNPVLLPWSQNFCHIPQGVVGPGCLSGIAFDPLNNSLWLSANSSSIIWDYSLNGTLLDFIDAGHPLGYTALGFDAADNTLWTTADGSNVLVQYALDPAHHGQVEQFGTPLGLPAGNSFYTAGDFQATPEPASFVLLASVVLALRSVRMRKRFETEE